MRMEASIDTSTDFEHVPCALCGEDHEKFLFSARDKFWKTPGSYRVVKCSKCDLVYLNPRLSPEAKTRLYNENYAFQPGEQAQILEHYRPVIEFVNGAKPVPGKILDVGTGNSPFLPTMRDGGWAVTGTEVNADLVDYFNQEHEIEVFNGELEQAEFDDGQFDAVTIMGVLEHVRDPASTLREAARILDMDGILGLWCFNRGLEARVLGRHWLGFDTPRHNYSFSAKTLNLLLEQAGFKPVGSYHRPHSAMAITTVRAGHKIKNRLLNSEEPVHSLRIPKALSTFYMPLGKALAAFKTTSDVYLFAQKAVA
jgi:2-polyprenyl-3-methyl-5-hydroxy-6-metoxy-1,4-benzoquinol methylase